VSLYESGVIKDEEYFLFAVFEIQVYVALV
jgi:hypothetical protein